MTAFLLAALALLPVHGNVGDTTGALEGVLDGVRLELTTPDGSVSCQGRLTRLDDDGGLGEFACSDGRSGSFTWGISDNGFGRGSGYFDGEPLDLFFG